MPANPGDTFGPNLSAKLEWVSSGKPYVSAHAHISNLESYSRGIQRAAETKLLLYQLLNKTRKVLHIYRAVNLNAFILYRLIKLMESIC